MVYQANQRRDEPEPAERTDRLASAATDVGDQLNQTSMQLALDRSVNRAKPLLYRRRRVRLMAAHRINQEQLLLNADRERLSRAERVAELIVRTQVSTLPVASAGGTLRTQPAAGGFAHTTSQRPRTAAARDSCRRPPCWVGC